MKAFGVTKYGPLDSITELRLPLPEPARGEVRVRVAASALNPADYKVADGTMKFLHGRGMPLVLGYDFSGTVDGLGPGVSGFAVGDDVFGFLPYSPMNGRGAFAEYLVARVGEIARKPASVSHVTAATAATAGVTAIQSLRDLGGLAPGGRVLITGVSGGVGSLAVGIAKRLGAQVTAVGTGQGLAIARRMGAHATIDRSVAAVPGDIAGLFDVIFDAAAVYRWRAFRRALRPGGAFVTTLPSLAFLIDKVRSLFTRTRVDFVAVKSRPRDLELLAQWLEDGLEVPLDSTVALSDVGAGLKRLREGSAKGRVGVVIAE